jgi:integrase
MSAPRERTATPGIYRRGGRYQVRVRDASGRGVSRSARTLAEARLLRAQLSQSRAPVDGRLTVAAYADDWLETYRGRRGAPVRPSTLRGYRADLDQHVLPALGRRRLTALGPPDVRALVAGLERKGLSPARIRNVLAPLRCLLATAREDGLIADNPAAGIRLPAARRDDDDQRAKALTPEELQRLIAAVPDGWERLLVRFVAATGLRISETLGLRWSGLDLDGGLVHVREALVKGERGAPKSRYGRRVVPLPAAVVAELRRHRMASAHSLDEHPVFATGRGTPYLAGNLRRRMLQPAAERAGLVDEDGRAWPGFHTLRHTCATRLFLAGASAPQVQRWLGHHSPAFTLATYVHLMPADLPDRETLAALVAASAS